MGLVDYEQLVSPKREMSPRAVSAIDFLSWALPAAAAVCSTASGVLALNRSDAWAAWLGILGGVSGASGVMFTNWASRIRDRRLDEARNLGALGVDMVDSLQRRMPAGF